MGKMGSILRTVIKMLKINEYALIDIIYSFKGQIATNIWDEY